MEEEPIALSTRDRDRLKVLSKAKKGLITQKQAAQHLDVTDLQIRRRVTRMREQRDRSILHGLRGQASNPRIPEAAKQQALSLLATKAYVDFGPTLASEYLGKKRGLWIGKETVRKWMTEAGLWRVHPAKIEKVHQWPHWQHAIRLVSLPVGHILADLPACFPKIAEPVGVQAFIAQAAIETFSECILNRLAWLDMGEVDQAIDSPGKKVPRGLSQVGGNFINEWFPRFQNNSVRPQNLCR